MKAWKWLGSAVLAVSFAMPLVGCTTDRGNPVAVVGPLERAIYGAEPIEVLDDCGIIAMDVFGNGGYAMPFEISCEDMSKAEMAVTKMSYNRNGCMVEVRGWVYFSDTRHRYSFRASTSGCAHDGGTLEVCGLPLGGCRTLNLPYLAVGPVTVPAPAK